MKYKSLKATNEFLTGKTNQYNKAMNKTILLAASALTGAATAAMAQQHTNIVLINLDDAGYGDFSYNGAHGYTTKYDPHIWECAPIDTNLCTSTATRSI